MLRDLDTKPFFRSITGQVILLCVTLIIVLIVADLLIL